MEDTIFGRYEVGTQNARSESSIGNVTDIAKIKGNLKVYNYITRNQAKEILDNMYIGKSRLCSSYAWDTALKFIDGVDGTYSINSEGGNYRGELKDTGNSEPKKNIYDMGGNIWEYTTEYCTKTGAPYASRRR